MWQYERVVLLRLIFFPSKKYNIFFPRCFQGQFYSLLKTCGVRARLCVIISVYETEPKTQVSFLLRVIYARPAQRLPPETLLQVCVPGSQQGGEPAPLARETGEPELSLRGLPGRPCPRLAQGAPRVLAPEDDCVTRSLVGARRCRRGG